MARYRKTKLETNKGVEMALTTEQFLQEHKRITEEMHATSSRKNADYAGQGGGADAFANFRMIERLSGGVITTEVGMITRMTDKLSRITSLMTSGKEAKVKDESVMDTLIDLANYCVIMAIYVEQKKAEKEAQSKLVDQFAGLPICAEPGCMTPAAPHFTKCPAHSAAHAVIMGNQGD